MQPFAFLNTRMLTDSYSYLICSQVVPVKVNRNGHSSEWTNLIWYTLLIVFTSNPNGPFTRCVKLRVAHALGMPGTFSPQQRVSDPDMHHGTCVTHVPWCMPGSLTSGFLWRGNCSRHSQRMRSPLFYVYGKRPMDFVPPIDSKSALIQVVTWRLTGDNPLPEPTLP